MLNRGAFGSLFGKLMKPLRITENAYVHTDRLGSITNIKNKKGSDMSNSWYDAWENVTTNISSSLSSAYSDMVENLSRHYTTYLYDDITDKYYASDRTYDSAVKRFTTRDAVKGDIRNASTLNAYIYVLNNPLKYIDPMGQSPVSAIGDWASSVGSTVGNALGAVKNTVGSVMNSIGNAFKGAADSAWSVISDIKDSITNFSPSQFLKDARDSIAGVVGTFQQSVSSFFEAMSGSGISYNEGSTDTGIPAWGKIALGITGAAIAIGILAGTMGGMAAAVSVGSELLLGSLLGGATDAAISLACGERDTNELLHDLADGAIDGFMFTGIFAPIGAAGAVSRYAKNAEGFVSKGSISKAGYGAESGSRTKATFVSDEKLLSHFYKHGGEFKGAFNSAEEYLQGAQNVMQNGYKVEYVYKGGTRTGYVQFMGNNSKGNAKFAFVGTNNEGYITTFHTESGKTFWKMLNGVNNPVINPK